MIDLAKTLQLFEQAPMSLPFDELFRRKLQKVPRFVKQDEKSSILPKLCNFSNKLPCFGISKKLQKVAHFVRKHEKSSIWSKLCNFGNKLPCLCISMNFSEKSCKKCLVS